VIFISHKATVHNHPSPKDNPKWHPS